MRGMQWGPIPCRRSWTSVSESVNAPVPMVATEQNLFGAKDGRVVELFQENHAFFQKLCDLQAAVCHVVSVACERGGVRQSPFHFPHAHFTPARQSRHAVLPNRCLRHLPVDRWVGPPCGAAGTQSGKASARHYRANFCTRLPRMSPT